MNEGLDGFEGCPSESTADVAQSRTMVGFS
jgi:hypothetical protein